MKAHELARKLLAGPDVEVHTWYDCEHLPLDEVKLVTKKEYDRDPEPPYVLFI